MNLPESGFPDSAGILASRERERHIRSTPSSLQNGACPGLYHPLHDSQCREIASPWHRLLTPCLQM